MKVKSRYDIIIGEYPYHQQLKNELVPLLENYSDKQGRMTNVQATMTEWDWGKDILSVKKFKKYILNKVPVLISHGGAIYSTDYRDFWGNIYHKNDCTYKHNHLPYYMSFVYFLKAKWYNSSLVFTDYDQKVRPIEGRYVIFPSHLQHHVPKHRFKQTRMTLSGNISIHES